MATQPEYTEVDHISITVRDAEAAKHFYADVLGIPVVTDIEFDDSAPTPYDGLHDAKHATRRRVIVGPIGGVHLVLIGHPGDELQGESRDKLDRVGVSHIAINVRDLQGLIERASSFGVAPVAPGFFQDPDGNLIQIESPTTTG
jgi:catechol 2,3-dioxygenase-like lactoylglutathione lyase family enzyme